MKNTTPKISVIIPVYNVEPYLRQCLDSVINQTLKEIEIICVDDGSTDKSLEILKEYAAKDKRITIITQKNQGLSIARNNTFKITRGEYMQFLDSDDWLRNDACELLYNHAHTENLDMLHFNGYNIDHEMQQPLYNYNYLSPNFNTAAFRFEDCQTFCHLLPVGSCLTIYRSEFIKKHNLTFPDKLFFEDTLFFTKALFSMKRMGINKEKLYYRRIHNASITQNWDRNFADYLTIIDMVLNFIGQQNNNDILCQYKKRYINDAVNRYNKMPDEMKQTHKNNLKRLLNKYRIPMQNNSSDSSIPPPVYCHHYYLFGFIPFLKITVR